MAIWPPLAPGPTEATIIWRIEIESGAGSHRQLLALLSQEERSRAYRFLRADDRDRFVVGHAGLRRLLAAHLETEPADLTFARSKSGKPCLGGRWNGRLHFNLAHSGHCVLIAISPTNEIGVDVEIIRPISDWLRVARAHFSAAELEALSRLPSASGLNGFFSCWTRKEAVVKALGSGLAMSLQRFSVAVPPHTAELLEMDGDTTAGYSWSLRHLEPLAGHLGCVAAPVPNANFALRTLTRSRVSDAP